MARRLQVRRFRHGEKKQLIAKLHDRKLPFWIAQRYRITACVYQELSVRAAAQYLGCAKETAYRCVKDLDRHGFRNFECSSNPDGRPSQITEQQMRTRARVAQKRPTDVGLPFTNWSMTKLQDYLVKRLHFPVIGPEWLRQLLHRIDVSWQHTKTWKQSHDPDFAAKKACFGTIGGASRARRSCLLQSTGAAGTASWVWHVLGTQAQTAASKSDLYAPARHRTIAWLLRCSHRWLGGTRAQTQDGRRDQGVFCQVARMLPDLDSHLRGHGQSVGKYLCRQ
jgi:transposase